jgi:A/G-specific adenine glycosylase
LGIENLLAITNNIYTEMKRRLRPSTKQISLSSSSSTTITINNKRQKLLSLPTTNTNKNNSSSGTKNNPITIIDDDDIPDIEDITQILSTNNNTQSPNNNKNKKQTLPQFHLTSTPPERESFRTECLSWYNKNKRSLPWRNPSTSPYGIWVSEIMCQQTRVETAENYWLKFMSQFPTIQSLSESSLDEVNQLWAGLGYYRRASQLHQGAKQVMSEYNGKLPSTSTELLKISGIGPYTAGAIASIAFKERVAAVDGNVIRVMSRWRACDEIDGKFPILVKAITQLVNEIIVDIGDDHKPGDFNQSIMELGAKICTPKSPSCESCPLQTTCRAKKVLELTPIEIASRFPARLNKEEKQAKKKNTPRIPVLIALLFSHDGNHVLSFQRPQDGGLLSGQWELCVCEGEKSYNRDNYHHQIKSKLEKLGVCVQCSNQLINTNNKSTTSLQQIEEIGNFNHIFSHLIHECVVVKMITPAGMRNCSCLNDNNNNKIKSKWIPVYNNSNLNSNTNSSSSSSSNTNINIKNTDYKQHGLTRAMTKALELLLL